MKCDEIAMSKIIDTDTDRNLYQYLHEYNSINVGYVPSAEFARRRVRPNDRKKGLSLTYYIDDDIINEIAIINDNDIDNEELWVTDESWQSNSLSGLLSKIPTVDNDDITVVNNVIKFADRKPSLYNHTTLGIKILRKNLVNIDGMEKNVLHESMFDTENTIYVVKYSYDLNTTTIKLPYNSTLLLYGGVLANGTIKGDCSDIMGAGRVTCNLTGSWKSQGVTTNRPENPIVGYSYYDTSINRPIWWNGVNWVNANGEVV